MNNQISSLQLIAGLQRHKMQKNKLELCPDFLPNIEGVTRQENRLISFILKNDAILLIN